MTISTITPISHEEFQFNAKILGFDIANHDNTYNARVLHKYLRQFFSDNQVHPVPNEMIIDDYFFAPKYFISFPKHKLEVLGNLNLSYNQAQVLPNTMIVKGHLDASFAEFKYFPNVIDIQSHIILHSSKVLELPDNLFVNGSLNIQNNKNIKVLPKNLNVLYNLFIRDTNIKEIPMCTKAKTIFKDF